MTTLEINNPLTGRSAKVGRIVGTYSQSRVGPLLVVLAGVHGNEPSGVQGLLSVLETLRRNEPPFFGTLAGIACNLPALAAGRRFLDEDLNRIWLRERVDPLRGGRAPSSSEERELLEVLEVIDDYRCGDNRLNYFLDCHTTSAGSIPYISVPHDSASVQLAGEFPVHTVIGGGDALQGVSDRYLIDDGFRGFTFEAGQHHRLASIECQAAAIWVALHRVGCLTEAPVHAEEILACTLIDGHKYFNFEHVHRITPESGFRMKPGYFNFQQIHKGDLLAWEHDQPVLSRWDARIFLPLYQPTGDDGFSVIREFSDAPGPETA